MSQNLRWLYVNRGLRSFATAFLTVVLPLYLAVSGYTAVQIGLVISLSGVVSIVLLAAVGFLADRGRKRTLIGLGALAVLGGVAMALSPALWVIVLASGLGGVGKGGGAGSGGSWGPFLPAEQPLLADSVTAENRTRVFGQISFVGVLTGAVGSLVAGVPAWLHQRGWSWIAGYHLLFLFSAGLAVVMMTSALPLVEVRPRAADPAEPAPPPPAISFRRLIGRLGLTNSLNGLAMGFMGPLLTYWFYRRFGAGTAELGVLYALVNLSTAIPYLLASRIAKYMGAVKAVSVTRALSTLSLLGMAFMPVFWAAGGLFLLRMVFNSLGMPTRQSYTMGVSDDRHRSRVSAFSTLPSQVTAMISPVIGGAEMGSLLDFPIFGAVFFMSLNVIAYYLAFRHVLPPEEVAQAGPSVP